MLLGLLMTDWSWALSSLQGPPQAQHCPCDPEILSDHEDCDLTVVLLRSNLLPTQLLPTQLLPTQLLPSLVQVVSVARGEQARVEQAGHLNQIAVCPSSEMAFLEVLEASQQPHGSSPRRFPRDLWSLRQKCLSLVASLFFSVFPCSEEPLVDQRVQTVAQLRGNILPKRPSQSRSPCMALLEV